MDAHVVDVNRPGLDLLSQLQASPEVLGIHGSRKAIVSIIRKFNRCLIRSDSVKRHRRPKGLGVEDVHVLRHALNDHRPHGGFHIGVVRSISVHYLRAFAECVLQKILVLADGSLADQRQARVLAKHLVHRGLESLLESVRDFLVHDDALRRHADLACVQKSTERAAQCGFLEVGVFADDRRRFAAELHQGGLQELGGLACDDGAGGSAAGEVDLANRRGGDECRCHFRGVLGPVDDGVEDSFGQAGFM